jgi:hypothetical protein
MCQNLGLNRNCDSWNLSDQEKEERKRVFYCCFVVDRLSCAMHGRAPMMDERDLDTPYPSEADEDNPHIMEVFHQLIRLCEILNDILTQLYMVKGRKRVAHMTSPDNVISKLDRKLNTWMANLPPSVQYRPPNTRMAETAPAPTLELCQIHMLYYTSLILLHRPFIPGPTQPTGTPSVFPSASICTYAANKILDIVVCLMAEKGRLQNVNNYALYFMFTAGIIFINDALSDDAMFAFEAKISINKIIRAMDEVETTWITSARHCNILGELAGLRDINLTNCDERPKTRRREPPPEALSIAVPNSPVMPNAEEYSHHPIDAERGTDLPAYLSQYVPPPQPNSSRQSTPANSYTSQQYAQTPTSTTTTTNNFDPIGTAFWGVPMSFDIDEWNSYFSNQTQNATTPPSSTNQDQQQQCQQQSQSQQEANLNHQQQQQRRYEDQQQRSQKPSMW